MLFLTVHYLHNRYNTIYRRPLF